MPDWRKAEGYDFPESFPRPRWAWEFLRRNPEYIKDWSAALQRFQSRIGEFQNYTHGNRTADPEDPGFYIVATEREKWHLHALLNPSTNEPEHLRFELDFGKVHMAMKGQFIESRGPSYPLVEINLSLPLPPQFESAERQLKRIKELLHINPRTPKKHIDLWGHYLRLLDADLDGRKPSAIADVLLNEHYHGLDEKKIWDQLRAARRLRTPAGYLAILRS